MVVMSKTMVMSCRLQVSFKLVGSSLRFSRIVPKGCSRLVLPAADKDLKIWSICRSLLCGHSWTRAS